MAELTYPLSIQMNLSEDIRDHDFLNRLQLISKIGFTGVELNITRPEHTDVERLKKCLDEYGMKMTAYATGALAKKEGLSLSSNDENICKKSVQRCKEVIKFSKEMGADVILGFVKGSAAENGKRMIEIFKSSIKELEICARENGVVLLIEATNRYESAVANTLEDAYTIIECTEKSPCLKILPDTFHMNIEEYSTMGALGKFLSSYHSIHLSDNNRLFPGMGAIDFPGLFKYLKDIGYNGRMTIEGNIRDSFERDVVASTDIILPMLKRI